MSTAIPVAFLRIFAWIILIATSVYGLFLLIAAALRPITSAASVIADVVGILVGVPVIVGGILIWAFLLAFAGGVEAVVELRDMKRNELDEAEYAQYPEYEGQEEVYAEPANGSSTLPPTNRQV